MQQTRRRHSETNLPLARGAGSAEARRLRNDLRHSVREGGLTLAFQPRRRLHDHATLGAEAQLRWPCRGRGVMQASTFMPLLDECGLGQDVLAWTLNAACQAAASWQHGSVSVSVPALAAQDGSLLPLVGNALERTQLDPERLEIALHDCAAPGDCAETVLALAALRDRGIGVALEEFGRTRACLIKLKHLPLSTIKLDRSLVRDVGFDRSAAAMARALIDYAHALGIEVAAGVETKDQHTLLRELGCDAGIERAGLHAAAD